MALNPTTSCRSAADRAVSILRTPCRGHPSPPPGRNPPRPALRGLPDPVRSELVRLTFRGIRRAHGRPQRRTAARFRGERERPPSATLLGAPSGSGPVRVFLFLSAARAKTKTQGNIGCFFIEYPESETKAWDRIVTRMSLSLR